MVPDPVDEGVWELKLPGTESSLIDFDRVTVDISTRDVTLFTWGTEEANTLYGLLAHNTAIVDQEIPNWAGELIPDETKLPL